jgi:hypothetical protein
VIAFALSFFSGSGLSDVCSPPPRPISLHPEDEKLTGTQSTHINTRSSPSKVHSPLKSWISGTAGSQNIWLRMLEHLSPVQAVA